MEQKNTIVKCKAHPDCLFNHNGVCDNYVINIGENGKCECYVETELIENVVHTPEKIGAALKEVSKQMDIQRGQRAQANFYEDTCDDKCIVKIPDAKNMDIHFVIQNAQWNEEFLRDQMCWYCDNGLYGECKLITKPDLDRTGRCPRYKSTGGNR